MRGSKLASQFCFGSVIFFVLRCVRLHLSLILFAIALLLLRSKLASQLILVQLISLIVFRIHPFFFWLTLLRGDLNPERGGSQLTPGWDADAVRARQLRANALFHLGARCTGSACSEAKDRCSGRCGCGC